LNPYSIEPDRHFGPRFFAAVESNGRGTAAETDPNTRNPLEKVTGIQRGQAVDLVAEPKHARGGSPPTEEVVVFPGPGIARRFGEPARNAELRERLGGLFQPDASDPLLTGLRLYGEIHRPPADSADLQQVEARYKGPEGEEAEAIRGHCDGGASK